MLQRFLCLACFCVALIHSASGEALAQNWVLAWSDEFDGPENSAPDSSKWGFDIGGGGWGNNELQYYTSRLQNAFVDGRGNLIIRAVPENYTGADGVTRGYTSARLLTKGRFEQTYGRFEARLQLPFSQGLWPAFWLLGNNIEAAGWPGCGEIDVMENRGREPSVSSSALHGPGYSGNTPLARRYTLPAGERFQDGFHLFAVEWEPAAIRFYVDGNLHYSVTPADLPAKTRWVFDHPFFVLLNVAVGGNFGGNPDATTTWPQTMKVDYVRVYKDVGLEERRPVITEVSVSGKNLVVTGEKFDAGATIMMNGEPQKTRPSGQPPRTLTGKKLAKKIPPGGSAKIQVRNSDGVVSNELTLTR